MQLSRTHTRSRTLTNILNSIYIYPEDPFGDTADAAPVGDAGDAFGFGGDDAAVGSGDAAVDDAFGLEPAADTALDAVETPAPVIASGDPFAYVAPANNDGAALTTWETKRAAELAGECRSD